MGCSSPASSPTCRCRSGESRPRPPGSSWPSGPRAILVPGGCGWSASSRPATRPAARPDRHHAPVDARGRRGRGTGLPRGCLDGAQVDGRLFGGPVRRHRQLPADAPGPSPPTNASGPNGGAAGLASWRPTVAGGASRGSRRVHLHPSPGGLWLIGPDGAAAPLRAMRGSGYLRELLRRPGQPVAALDLVAAGTGVAVQSGLGDVLDRQAPHTTWTGSLTDEPAGTKPAEGHPPSRCRASTGPAAALVRARRLRRALLRRVFVGEVPVVSAAPQADRLLEKRSRTLPQTYFGNEPADNCAVRLGGRMGRRTRNTVFPGRESMVMRPPWRSTTVRRAMSRPRPVPLPASLVV